MLERLTYLYGNKINDIKNKTVLIIGLGGVGSYALESIARSGVNNIIIVDNDTIDIFDKDIQVVFKTNYDSGIFTYDDIDANNYYALEYG